FQAEDGIRDRNVTGVQTCALPILSLDLPARTDQAVQATCAVPGSDIFPWHMPSALTVPKRHLPAHQKKGPPFGHVHGRLCSQFRSEERRVGKECRSQWGAWQKELR